MYAAGRPASGAFSGRPCPFGRWQYAQAHASSRPCATMRGIGGSSKISALIAEQEKLIALLKDRRRST
jgi:hypothetical protein